MVSICWKSSPYIEDRAKTSSFWISSYWEPGDANTVAVAVVGVNPGNPEAEVLSCGFFPHGLDGDMLASLTASQTLIPNRRVAVATYPSRTGVGSWCIFNYSLLCGVGMRREQEEQNLAGSK